MSSALRALAIAAVAACSLAAPPIIHAQGCAQCRDNTASTTPATQRAYAHAIELMSGAAAAFFVVTVLLIRRQP